jgi:hypothetical protein
MMDRCNRAAGRRIDAARIVLIQGFCAIALPGQAVLAGWETGFARPPADCRILKIIHNWPDQNEAQDRLISGLRDQGFGGVVCNVSFDGYLEDEAKWLALVRAVNEAKRQGLALWLYDERGYPSGNAGGITLRGHPEWEARGLLVAEAESQGGPVTLDVPPGRQVLVKAFEVRQGSIDLASGLDLAGQVRDARLTWQAPVGQWLVMAITEDRLYEGTHAEGNLAAKMAYVNLLVPEATARFVDVTYGGYARHLGDDLGRTFMATFTDEPSLMSLFLRPMPYRPLPWAQNLAAEFKRRRGHDLETAMLPALAADAGPAGRKIRYDFWLTVAEMVSENFFGQIQARCGQYHVPSGGHLLAEEGIAGHVALYGDFFRCIRRLDAPSIDCLTSLPNEVPWFIARLVSSAAELESKPLVMSETSDHSQHYRPDGDTRPRRVVTEAEIRGTCNRQIVAGVNCITSYYSFTDLSDEGLRRLNDWVGRCCAGLRGGHQVADVCVLYPAESLWTRFVPSRQWTREAGDATRVETLYRTAVEALFAGQRDFTVIDSRTLTEARVESSSLVYGQLRWRVVILPAADTLPLTAWENLGRFVRQGGVVISLGTLPANSEDEFPCGRVQALAREIFGGARPAAAPVNEPASIANAAGGEGVFLPFGLEGLLPLVLNGLLEPDVQVAGLRSPIRATRRRIDDHEVYFLINDSARPWSGEVRLAAVGQGGRWNPATGQKEETLASGAFQLSLEPYCAALFRYGSARPTLRRLSAPGAGLPGFSLRPVPWVEPTAPHGEFVAAELAPDADRSTAGAPVWQARGVLTKAQVDTFLFVQFHYPRALDLGQASCLVVDSWVPDGQSTPNQLLVILHEEGGGDFIADTGRSLAAAGRERSFVALTRFQLAGWSQDSDGVLDPSRIQDIRIGWGGYLGAKDEKVQFSAALPLSAMVRPAE